MLSPFSTRHHGAVVPVRCAQLMRTGMISMPPSQRCLTVVHCASNYNSDEHKISSREALIASREDKLWNRMEQLLDREAHLREDEAAAARGREAHLQSQLDMLLSVISNQQTERSLPPSAVPSAVHAQSGTPLDRDLETKSIENGPAHQSHGTFDTADESSVGEDVQAGLDSILASNSTPEPATVQSDVQEVISAVLSKQIDPLDNEFFSRYGTVSVDSSSDTVSDATSPAPAPVTPTTASNAAVSSASAQGGAVPPHVAAALDESRDALQEQSSGNSKAPVEHQKAAPGGPPPVLSIGDDDIYWAALLKEGCYCGEMDEDDFYFGSGTQNALLTFQAMKQMPETGISDDATWAALGLTGSSCAEDGYVWQRGDNVPAPTSNGATNGSSNGNGSAVSPPTSDSSSCTSAPAEDGYIWQQGGATSSSSNTSSNKADTGAPFGGLFKGLGMSLTGSGPSEQPASIIRSGGGSSEGVGESESEERRLYKAERQDGEAPKYSRWPVLREGDGDRAVHTLHVLLLKNGYYCDEEDTKWWMFGSTTQNALQTFQACSGLPESGVCDERTWNSLMGADACPQDIDLWWSGDGDDEDMEQIGQGAVYFLGEQRWSTKAKST